MAGSLKNFEYTADDGTTYAVNMDESNGEAVGNADFVDASTATTFIPRNLVPRTAIYASADGRLRRTICITSNAATSATLPSTIDVTDGLGATITLSLSLFKGETFKTIPKAADTGLDDGDAT